MFLQANDEKMRLEEKQRQERTAVEAAGKPWEPRWFEQVRCFIPQTQPSTQPFFQDGPVGECRDFCSALPSIQSCA